MTGLGTFTRLATAVAVSLLVVPAGVAQGSNEPFSRLPRQESPGAQIGWFVNQTLDAFVAAVEANKALIVVFGDKQSPLTAKLADLVAACPQLNQLAGVAVFAYASPNVDEYARRMASHLKLTVYPTISMIAPRTDRLTEVHRIEGVFDADTTSALLAANLRRNDLWPQGRAGLKNFPQHALAFPNQACNWEGAKRLGLIGPDQQRPRLQ